MVAITDVVIFLMALAVIYPAATAVLALLTWFRKRRVMQVEEDSRELLERIDESTDKLKEQLFIISIVVTFFVIAPFLVLLLVFNG